MKSTNTKNRISKKNGSSDKKGASHDKQLQRLARIEGQVRGISRMIEEKRYCMEILPQLKAAISGLKAVQNNITKEHMNHCVAKAIDSGDKKRLDETFDEIMLILHQSQK